MPRRVRSDKALVERARHRHQLEDRPRLVRVRDRFVAEESELRLVAQVWLGDVGRRPASHRQNFSRLRLDYDHAAAGRLGLLDCLVQLGLREALDITVDCKDHVSPSLRRDLLPFAHGQLVAESVPLVRQSALRPAENVVQVRL